MNIDTNTADVILDAVLNDKNIGKAGYRNDLMVDACIAGVCFGLDQVDLEGIVNKAIAEKMVGEDPINKSVCVQMTLEHIDRIWPYAKRWFYNGETAEKLLGTYSNNGDN